MTSNQQILRSIYMWCCDAQYQSNLIRNIGVQQARLSINKDDAIKNSKQI